MLTFCRLKSSTEGLARVIALVTGKLWIWLLREIFCSITEKEKSVNHFQNIEDVLKFDAFCKNIYWRYRVGDWGGGTGWGIWWREGVMNFPLTVIYLILSVPTHSYWFPPVCTFCTAKYYAMLSPISLGSRHATFRPRSRFPHTLYPHPVDFQLFYS